VYLSGVWLSCPMSSYCTQTLTSLVTEWLIYIGINNTVSSSRHIAQTCSDLIIFRFLYTSCSEIALANARSNCPKRFVLAFLPTRKPWTRTSFIFFYCPLCFIKVSQTQNISFFPTRLSMNLLTFSFPSLLYFPEGLHLLTNSIGSSHTVDSGVSSYCKMIHTLQLLGWSLHPPCCPYFM
jgi:hypothetical protein